MIFIHQAGDLAPADTVAVKNFRSMDQFAPGAVMHEDPAEHTVQKADELLTQLQSSFDSYCNGFRDVPIDMASRVFLHQGNLYLGVSSEQPYVGAMAQEQPDVDEDLARQLLEHAGYDISRWRSLDKAGQVDYFFRALNPNLNRYASVLAHVSTTPKNVVCELWMPSEFVERHGDGFERLVHSFVFIDAPLIRHPF